MELQTPEKTTESPATWTKIGEGRYREIYRISDDIVIKVLKAKRTKSYGLFTVSYPTEVYTRRKFGVSDFNDEEYRNYCRLAGKIPISLRSSFSAVFGVVETCSGIRGSLAELVRDYDGGVSLPLNQGASACEGTFWERLQELEEFLVNERIWLMDIRGENLVVKRNYDGTSMPVFIDYKRIGSKTYPFQFLMRFESQIRRRMRRRFERLRRDYQN